MPKSPARTAGHPVAYRFVVRRRLLIAAVFLLVGAVVNVAVAWGFAIRVAAPTPRTAITDLLALLDALSSNPGGPPDFDGDGDVGMIDLVELLANWGSCP